MIYQYSPLSGTKDPRPAIYPLIPVIFIYRHQIINYTIKALVDSGAENCYCLKAIGDYLRIDFRWKKKIVSRAANQTEFTGYLENVFLMVGGKKIETPFIFTDQLDPDFPVVLGQKGFFSSFEVCFQKSQNTFSVN